MNTNESSENYLEMKKRISKLSDNFPPKEYIRILIEGAAPAILPRFDKGAMYKGMIIDEEYTLEELEL